jgi:hypothetical protein
MDIDDQFGMDHESQINHFNSNVVFMILWRRIQ